MTTTPLTVLIAEDDDQFRVLVERLLIPDYRVVTAPNGEDAFALAKEEHPDVILTDVLMPKMTGVDLLRSIKDYPETKDIPVVILLATATNSDISAVESLNADGIIPKEEISRDALRAVITKVSRN